MKKFKFLCNFHQTDILAVLVFLLMTVISASALPIEVEIDSSQFSIFDFEPSFLGDELQIDYLVTNISSFADPSNAFKTIEISAGISNTVYEALAPQGWTASILEDKTVFSTGDSLSYIYPDDIQAVSFSLFYENIAMSTGQGLAMTPLGLWTETVPVTIAVPEPSIIALLGFGSLLFLKRNRSTRSCKKQRSYDFIFSDYYKSL